MLAKDFLSLLLPQQGYIVLTPQRRVFNAAGQSKDRFKNVICSSIDEALSVSTELVWEGQDLFFALATFEKKEVWNPDAINRHTGGKGKFESRSQANAKALKSFFVDIDINANPITYAEDGKVLDDKSGVTYPTREDALAALKQVCKTVGLPRPMIVNSGGGMHCYWPLAEEVDARAWREVAFKFKAICAHLKFRIDPKVPADSARVLRLLGTYNFKRPMAREVMLVCKHGGLMAFEAYDQIFSSFMEREGVNFTAPKAYGRLPVQSILGDNMGTTNTPVNPDMMGFHCEQFARQVMSRGAGASEPLWYSMLGLAKFCEKKDEVLRAVSDHHANYDEAEMLSKVDRWMAPATCKIIDENNPGICPSCPMWGKIKSPAVMGNILRNVAAPVLQPDAGDPPDTPVIELPNPPAPYIRFGGKIVTQTEDKDGKPVRVVICPFDLYPVKVTRQNGPAAEVRETSMWCLVLERLGPTYMEIPQNVISNPHKLGALLFDKGGYHNPGDIKDIQTYMSAYLRELTRMLDREKCYEVFGWQAEDQFTEFMLGENVIHADGSVSQHKVGAGALTATKGSIRTRGSHAEWFELVKFYSGPGNEAARLFLYGSFGSTLMAMTLHKSLLIAASGASGQGKSTVMEMQASVWGSPSGYLINGNKDGITSNALFNNLSVYHNLPYLVDETTERDPEEMRRFALMVTQGIGKERMKGNEHDGMIRKWAALVFTSANLNELSRMMSAGKGNTPHMARIIAVDFELPDASTEAKIKADAFKLGIRENYGWAGLMFMQYVVPNHEEVQARLNATIARFDRTMQSNSMERYWTLGLAVILTGGQVAYEQGIIPFNPMDDFDWMCNHMRDLRSTVNEANLSPMELLTEFLNANISNTLVLSSRTSNISNVALTPRGMLHVRVELDTGGLFIARSAILDYFNKNKVNFKQIEDTLLRDGVLIAKNRQKVLGADSSMMYGGQVRCWVVDTTKLGAAFNAALQQAMQTLASGAGAPVVP